MTESVQPLPISDLFRPWKEWMFFGPSKHEGQGLFTSIDLAAGIDLGYTHAYSDDPAVLLIFPDGWIRAPWAGFYNHNEDDPNCHTWQQSTIARIKVKKLITSRPIKAGEELTAKYTLYRPTT